MIVRESISFERGKTPRDSMRIGRKARFRGRDSYEVADAIYNAIRSDYEIDALERKGEYALRKHEIEDWDDYFDMVETGEDGIKDLDDILIQLEDRIQEMLNEGQYPITRGKEGNVHGIIFSMITQGGAKKSIMYSIQEFIDEEYLKESINFEKGLDPKEKMGIGDEELQIYNKMSSIANYLGIHEYGTDDLNQQKVIATWKMPGIIGELDTTGYGRIILYKNDIGGSTEYQMYARGVRGSDIQSWTKWDTVEKWEENLRYLLNESVNFERGKDPRHAMEVGAIVDTPEIKGMDIEMGEDGIINSYEDYLKSGENTWGEDMNDDDFITDVLENWEDEAIYAYSFWINDPTEEDEDWEYWHAPEMEGETLLWKGKLYTIPKTGKFKTIADGVSESVNFERGKDPRHSMGIGNIAELPRKIYDLSRESINNNYPDPTIYSIWFTDRHQGSDVPVLVINTGSGKRDLNRYLIKNGYDQYIQMPGKIVGKFSQSNKIAYPIHPEYWEVLKDFSSYEYGQQLKESISFERGKDPRDVMKIGSKELLKSDNLGLQTGWTLLEKERPSELLGKEPWDVYIIGFAGEIDHNEWHYNEFTEMLSNACMKGKVLGTKRYGDNVYVLIDTEFGKIVRAHMDQEGLYFYGGLDAALNIGIQDIPQPERESIF